MHDLRSMQAGFAECLLQITDNEQDKQTPSIHNMIVANGLSAKQRIQIYRNNLFTSLTAALTAVYPTVHKLVGDDFFQFMAHHYIPMHPSEAGDIHLFGKSLAKFIENFQPAESVPYLPDMARLDWTYHEVFHAADVSSSNNREKSSVTEFKNITELQFINTNEYHRLRFYIHPAARLLSSEYPILSIWEFNHSEQNESATLNIDSGGQWILVHRPELDIEFSRLSHEEYCLAKNIETTGHFAAACEKTIKTCIAAQLDQCLYSLINREIIIGFAH